MQCVHTEISKIEFILGDATTKFTIVVAHNGFLTPPPLTRFHTVTRRLDTTVHRVPGPCDLRAPHLVIDIAHPHPLGHISRLGLAAYCTEWPKAHSHMRRAVHAAAHTLSLAAHGARRTSRPRTMATRPAAPCRHTGRRKFSTVPAAGATTGSVKIFLSPPLMCRKRAWPPGI